MIIASSWSLSSCPESNLLVALSLISLSKGIFRGIDHVDESVAISVILIDLVHGDIARRDLVIHEYK